MPGRGSDADADGVIAENRVAVKTALTLRYLVADQEPSVDRDGAALPNPPQSERAAVPGDDRFGPDNDDR
jgi:hypothetical protein